MGTTISASANLTAPLGIIALDNDIEEVEPEQAQTLHVCMHTNAECSLCIG